MEQRNTQQQQQRTVGTHSHNKKTRRKVAGVDVGKAGKPCGTWDNPTSDEILLLPLSLLPSLCFLFLFLSVLSVSLLVCLAPALFSFHDVPSRSPPPFLSSPYASQSPQRTATRWAMMASREVSSASDFKANVLFFAASIWSYLLIAAFSSLSASCGCGVSLGAI